MPPVQANVLDQITQHYLTSRDFNGFPLRQLDWEEAGRLLVPLIQEGLVSVVFGDIHPNPYIRALRDEPVKAQLVKLAGPANPHACAYPTDKHLKSVVEPQEYAGKPFTLELALGAPQLEHRAFHPSVLERYRNDPRCSYDCDDIYGNISADAGEEGLRSSDQVFMRFGFAYENHARFVAGFLWDLHKLEPEQQLHWRHSEHKGKTLLHPDYYRTQVIGDWPERISIYAAFLEELRIINEMSVAMDRPTLFRKDYCDSRPREFASLLRPTQREFDDFVRLLDAMISDNLNEKFFQGDVAKKYDHERDDGRIEVRTKGSLQMLREWFDLRLRAPDRTPLEKMDETFRKIRKLRSKPSHGVMKNEFSQAIYAAQRDLMVEAYTAVRTIRLAFANHPKAKRVQVDEHLYKGLIWSR